MQKIKVCDMDYKRINIDYAINQIKRFASNLKNAKDEIEFINIRGEYLSFLRHVSSSESLASIRFTQNTLNDFYSQEKDYYDQNSPILETEALEFSRALLSSRFKDTAKINPLVLKINECNVKSGDTRIVKEQVEENCLVTSYVKIMSEMLFDFDGEKIPLTLLKKYMSHPNRNTRKKAFETLGNRLAESGQEIDVIFDKLVKLRNSMARKLGYKNFIELGYNRLGRIGFNENDVKLFRKNVKTEVVPIITKLKGQIADKLGIKDLKFYDNDSYFLNGNPNPVLSSQQMFNAAREMFHDMDGDTGVFFDEMLEADAFDVLSREGKWGGGYCTTIDDYCQPFILANFNGTSADVDVLTHETGHAFADYMRFKQKLDLELGVGGMETAETHSMSMEFFCWKYMDTFFGERSNDYKYAHLFDALTFIPYGTIVDEFQHIVYENEELSPSERNDVWLKLEKEYRPYLSFSEMPYLEKGTRWQYQMHIFEEPFYYIDYCLAQTNALQFLSLAQDDYTSAFNKYKAFLKCGGEQPFSELVKRANLKSPFEKGTLEVCYHNAEKLLKKLSN